MSSLSALALAAMLNRCTPNVAPGTMSAIVTVESHSDPLSIHDNLTGREYHPDSEEEAVRLAHELLARSAGTIDLGIAQINSSNLPGYGVSVEDVFDPCVNLTIGSRILSGGWRTAIKAFGTSVQSRGLVVAGAISSYNSNSLYKSVRYVATVVNAYYSTEVRSITECAYALRVDAWAQAHHQSVPLTRRLLHLPAGYTPQNGSLAKVTVPVPAGTATLPSRGAQIAAVRVASKDLAGTRDASFSGSWHF